MNKANQDSRDLPSYASLESMEGIAPHRKTHSNWAFAKAYRLEHLVALYPGAVAAGTIALSATFLSQTYGAPVMLFALLIGMAFHFLAEEGPCKVGIEFFSRSVLRLGVALLGLRVSVAQIASLGIVPVITVIVGVVTTTMLGLWLAQRLALGRYFGVLSGGAVAICGASAALAISAALPKYPAKERDTVLTVVVVTSLSTVAMILYPIVARLLNFSHVESGIFLGGTIHDVAQVVGAGYSISTETGDVATYVKLLRVAMLVPVVLAITLLFSAQAQAGAGSVPRFPLFLAAFAALVVCGSVIQVPAMVVQSASTVSNWCLVAAIAALGMKTSLRDLAIVGWRPIALMAFETMWIAALVVVALLLRR